jgi:hypothetical protein
MIAPLWVPAPCSKLALAKIALVFDEYIDIWTD